MAYYIKANPKVAAFLGLTKMRTQVADGNYLLWQADMSWLGSLANLDAIVRQIGGLKLRAIEAKQEQDGKVLRILPTATDERFIVETEEPTEEEETITSDDVGGAGVLTGEAGEGTIGEDTTGNGEETGV